jgi:acetoacetyl-CoA synthetase
MADANNTSKQTKKGKEDDKIAITEVREGCFQIRHVTWGELRRKVGRLSQAMRAVGVKKGDRVAVVASNSVDTVCVFFAVTALGGLFSSSSTDMGVKGVLDRLLQIKPRYVFMDDMAVYNGKTIDLREKLADIVKGMESISEFQGAVSMPRFDQPVDVSKVPRTQLLSAFLSQAKNEELVFERIAFRDPFLVVYSSGTTGQPKCIVHSVGSVIISSLKEGRLHYEQGPDSTVMQYTTTGWIMYLASIQTMMNGCRCVMYDGSPFLPNITRFVELVGEQKYIIVPLLLQIRI